MEERTWKIIVVILSLLCITEFIFIIWVFDLGGKIVTNKNMCIENVCGKGVGAIYYQYFIEDGMCECYDSEMNVIKQEYIG